MEIYAITNASGEKLDEYDINKKLEDMGIPDDVIQEGESAIDDYAFQNNINLDSLQPEKTDKKPKELKGSNNNVKQDYEKELQSLGVPDKIIAQGAEEIAAYADSNRISLPKAPTSGTALNLQL